MSTANARRFLSLAAVAGVLASTVSLAGPAWSTTEPVADPPPAAAGAEAGGSGQSNGGLSEAALTDAVQRDLGLTPGQFAGAGELGARASAAAVKLRDVPGYVGIRLEEGRIVVSGTGAELLEAVAALAADIPELAVAEPPATGDAPDVAVSTEQLFQAYLREVGPEGLQAVVATGGKFVIRAGGINSPESTSEPVSAGPAASGPGKVSPAEFVARYANVELDDGTPLAPEADVPGGVGYISDTSWICSTGFSAFNPAGLPAVLTAGHCASDGAAKTADLEFQFNRVGPLGEFGFSQYGGPGNARVVENPLDPDNPGNVGTDVAVIESLRPDVDPLPAASTWGDPSQAGPDVKIVGTADPVVGMPVCRSGRTSAWSCGTVDAVGIFIVPGPAYFTDPTDLRAFRGFLSYGVQSSGGDSGGPYVSGNYAVGTHAAGDTPDKNGNVIQNFAVGATLRESLAVLPGYQLELFLNKPVVTSPAPGDTNQPGRVISGTVPAAPAAAIAAGSHVRVTLQGEEPFNVPVDAGGNWSFRAPEDTGPEGSGTLRFTAETINGFSTSGAASFEFAQGEPPATAPSKPAPTEPVPTEPVPTEPASTGPTPTEPAPTEPTPTEPAPTEPTPAAPPASDDGGPAVVVTPPVVTPPADLADAGEDPDTGDLAYTGSSAILPAAGAALAAIAAGAALIVLVRRRKRRATE